jgi:hypothetical protein
MSEKTSGVNNFDDLPIVLTEEQIAELLQVSIEDIPNFIQHAKIKTIPHLSVTRVFFKHILQFLDLGEIQSEQIQSGSYL